MKRLTIGLVSTICAFALFGGASQTQTVTASGGLGEQVFQKSCMACHGADGNSGRAPDLVTQTFKQNHQDFNALKAGIQKSMPKNAPGSLTEAEYQAVAEYVWMLNGNTLANEKISVFVNKKELKFPVPPVLKNGTTLVPMREIFEAFGAEVKWDQATKMVTAVKGQTTVKLTIGSTQASAGSQIIKLTQAAQIIEGRTFVPLRFVSEALGAKVEWDEKTKVITISQ
ncbi:stalk domain-containing protein [Brevibacillus choshinensis]|nr:stalk domain-containing protein [Brevibacillus choshinensis]